MNKELELYFQYLKSLEGPANNPHLNMNTPESFKVRLIPDYNVSPAKFKRDTENPQLYRAHPVTIRAVKKDIFTASDYVLEDLEVIHECQKCHNIIDLQFWHFCPHCEANLPAASELKNFHSKM